MLGHKWYHHMLADTFVASFVLCRIDEQTYRFESFWIVTDSDKSINCLMRK